MKLLSIDFDYFVNTTREVRNSKFPVAEDITNMDEIKNLWDDCYTADKEIRNIGILNEDYYLLCDFLRHQSLPYLTSYSHKDIYYFTLDLQRNSETRLQITNIDFHHDNYYMYGGRVTCANWMMKLNEDFGFSKEDVLWVHRNDSETASIAGDFPYRRTTFLREALRDDYDAVFLCLSPEWTPPHLVGHYNKMKELLGK